MTIFNSGANARMLIKDFSGTLSVAAGAEGTFTKDISVNGYTPLGIVGFKTSGIGSTNANVKTCWLSDNSVTANIKNSGSATYSWSFYVRVLYVRYV